MERDVRELARLTGQSMTDAVAEAVRARLRLLKPVKDVEARLAAIDALVAEVRKLPVLDERPADEILGYNEHGTFD